ncbi:hypothetical protein [Kineococcus glutinatus]|uniref:Uncharacterized protein n=1 Tax=Kineococcus glutinatus TaxID=1070872 RepID=A0ABP9HDA0_9ACTN
MPANPDETGDPGGDLDVDAVFAEIVARWDTPSSPARAAEVAGEEDRESPSTAAPEARRTVLPLPRAPVEAPPPAPQRDTVPDAAPARGGRPEDEEPDPFAADGFVPPEPPPLPRDLVVWAAWAGVLGGPVVLLVAAVARGHLPGLVAAIAAAAFVAGFATLVLRLPSRREDDDDDGAVV